MEKPNSVNLSNPLRILIGLVLSVVSGLAFVLAFPPYEIWPLIFIGWIPLQIAQFRIMPKRLSSLASAVAIFVWLQGYLGPVFAPTGSFMIWLPLAVGIISLLAESSLRKFHHITGFRWFVPSGIASWAGSEMIRLFLPIAGTWAFIAYPLYRQLWLIQPVSIFGIIGLGMMIMLINLSLAMLLIALLDKRWIFTSDEVSLSLPLAKRWAFGSAAVLTVWIAVSLVQYNLPLTTSTVKVAAIQPSLSPIITANQNQDDIAASIRSRMVEQTQSAAQDGAQVIVWPEGALMWDPQIDSTQIDFARLAQDTNAFLAIGYVVNMENGFRNEATVIDPQGEFLGVFGKDHPVTFGGETSLSRGTYPVYDTSIGKLATIICYDLDYTDTTRKMVRQGAQLIAVPSNDWGSIADKHYSHVVFRAIENRVAMIKADGGYNSAIIDPFGHILALASFPEGGEATLVAEVQLGNGLGTLNSRLGDWTGWIGLAGMIFFTFGSGWLEKKARKLQKMDNVEK
jgi:apolipoprotein N-acyltransferase